MGFLSENESFTYRPDVQRRKSDANGNESFTPDNQRRKSDTNVNESTSEDVKAFVQFMKMFDKPNKKVVTEEFEPCLITNEDVELLFVVGMLALGVVIVCIATVIQNTHRCTHRKLNNLEFLVRDVSNRLCTLDGKIEQLLEIEI